MIEHNGISRTLTQWTEHTGIPLSTMKYRIKAKWSVEKLLTR